MVLINFLASIGLMNGGCISEKAICTEFVHMIFWWMYVGHHAGDRRPITVHEMLSHVSDLRV